MRDRRRGAGGSVSAGDGRMDGAGSPSRPGTVMAIAAACWMMVACASTPTGPATAAEPRQAGAWEAVAELDRGAEVRVVVRPAVIASLLYPGAGEPEVRGPGGSRRLQGKLVEVRDDGLALRHDEETLRIPRGDVLVVQVVEDDPLWDGALIGAGLTVGLLAAGGLFGVEDFTIGVKIRMAGLFGGAAAGLGALADLGRPRVRDVYRRSR